MTESHPHPDGARGGPGDDARDRPHVLVVDDDDRLRELLRRYLADNGFLVTTAANAAEARARLRTLSFDVMVLDVMMPGEDGMAFTRSLGADGGGLPVLLLTAMDAVEDRIRGLESGADDYLVKPFEPRELVLRLTAILRRVGDGDRPGEAGEARAVRFGDFVFDATLGQLSRDGEPVSLSVAEAGLLKTLAENAGRALSREALSGSSSIGARTVDVQITRLRRKIEADPRNPRHLVTVRGEGYALRAAPA